MSINKVIIKGRLGQDPEMNNAAVKFSMATNESYKNKQGEKVENTQWHNIVVFGKMGDVVMKYVKKGDELVVIGRIEYYKTDEGKYFTSIIANEFDFVSSKKDEPAF